MRRTCLSWAVVMVLAGAGAGFAGQDPNRAAGRPVPAGPPAVAGAPLPDGDWFTDEAAAAGLDFVHVNGMSGEYRFAEMMGPGAAVLDFDGDGDLDVYLPQGHALGPGDGGGRPRDRLYRNDLVVHEDGSRTLRFTDVTASSGLDVRSYGMGVATGDFDNDGRIDLFLTQLGPDRLFRNDGGGGTFTEAPGAGGASHPRWSLSAAVLDYDRDGWLDIFVSHYVDHDADGNAPCHAPTGERDYCGPQQYLPAPDRLYRNVGGGRFADRTAEAQVATEYGPGPRGGDRRFRRRRLDRHLRGQRRTGEPALGQSARRNLPEQRAPGRSGAERRGARRGGHGRRRGRLRQRRR